MTAAASCHGDTAPTTPRRRRAAAAHAPTTSTASATTLGWTGSGAVNGSSCTSSAVNAHGPSRRCGRTHAASHAPSTPAAPAPRRSADARHRPPWPATPRRSRRRRRPGAAGTTPPAAHASPSTNHTGHGAGEDRRHRGPTAAGRAPTGQAAAARTAQLASPKTPFDLDNIATYHDHGCLQSTKHRPSRPAREREGRCAFQNVIRLSSHTNKGPPAGSPCDHHRDQRRSTTAPSSGGVPFNTARGIAAGDWVALDTPHGRVRARAKLNPSLDPQVVFGQHGWWEACDELGLPGYPPYGPNSANLNLVLRQTPSDPISGSSPLRASVCNVSPEVTPVSWTPRSVS